MHAPVWDICDTVGERSGCWVQRITLPSASILSNASNYISVRYLKFHLLLPLDKSSVSLCYLDESVLSKVTAFHLLCCLFS